MSAPRVAIVGAGYIANRWGQVLAALYAAGEVEIAGVADISPGAAQALADKLACPAFDGCANLLRSAAVDIAIIATPPAQHESDVIECLRRSVHALCEKPLTTDLASLAALEAAARNSQAVVAMASKYRHLEDVSRALSMVKTGAIGELLEVDIAFAKRVDMSGRWNSQRSVSGGGVLMDNGPHAVDLAQLFVGPVLEVSASHGPSGRLLPVEETVHLLMRGASGVMARAHVSWAVSSFGENFLVLYGTDATIEVGWKSSRLVSHGGEVDRFGAGFDGLSGMATQLRNFIHASCETQAWLMTPQDAFATVRVIATAYRSLETGAWERVQGQCLAAAC